MPVALFFSVVVSAVGGLVVVGVRRVRAYREAVRALGLDYVAADPALARRLRGVLPVFAQGEIECLHVGRSVRSGIGLAVFDLVRRHPHRARPGRAEVDHEGLVACLHGPAEGFDAERVTRWADERRDRYRIECAGAWIAVQPLSRVRDDRAPTVPGLQSLHADLESLLKSMAASA